MLPGGTGGGGRLAVMATTTTSTLKNFIDGATVDPADGRTQDVLNPATGEVIAKSPDSGSEDVDRAVKAARTARQ